MSDAAVINNVMTLLEQIKGESDDVNVFDGVSQSVIERELGSRELRVPYELAEWFRICGGVVGHEFSILGLNPESDGHGVWWPGEMLDLPESWRVKMWIPVGTDGFGNRYVMSEVEKYVFFVDMSFPDRIGYYIATSLFKFIQLALKSERDRRDWVESRDLVEKDDPSLSSLSPLIWDV